MGLNGQRQEQKTNKQRNSHWKKHVMKTPLAATLIIGTLFGLVSTAPLCAQSTIVYEANLNGFSESPPNASPGTGFAEVIVHTGFGGQDDNMIVEVTFSGLLGTTTASHIHAATASPGTGTAGGHHHAVFRWFSNWGDLRQLFEHARFDFGVQL